jgi:hypothetical protein
MATAAARILVVATRHEKNGLTAKRSAAIARIMLLHERPSMILETSVRVPAAIQDALGLGGGSGGVGAVVVSGGELLVEVGGGWRMADDGDVGDFLNFQFLG